MSFLTKFASKQLLRTKLPLLQQNATIVGKTMRGCRRVPKCKPWPYKTKYYGLFTSLYEKTTKRFDDNSKIICIEGPMACGKCKVAQELADEFDMRLMPTANMDMIYCNKYGYDMRQLNDQLPESCRCYDEKDFHRNPKHPLAATFQLLMYKIKYFQYVEALQHVISTGQGVVLERSCFSDFVFVEAMYKSGYMSKGARSVYYDIRQNTIEELLRPHLIIYLDCPVADVQKNIVKRGLQHEIKSNALNDDFLKQMEFAYKHKFLKDLSPYSEILIYDWTCSADTEVLIDDIERLDWSFVNDFVYNKKIKDWLMPTEHQWTSTRFKYCTNYSDFLHYFNVPRFDVPELLRSGQDSKVWRDVWCNAPGMKYIKGYNADMGDKGLWFKTSMVMNEMF